jgi:hypothetical protein
MELQNRFDVYLDYKGYKIEDRSFRSSPSTLMGTRMNTGRREYSSMDFWNVGAMTEFSKGMNQKFLVDPAMGFYCQGLDLSKPGEYKLERDTESFSHGLSIGNITAHHRRRNELYLGDDQGHIIKSTNGTSFSIVHTITDTDKTITEFYEIGGRLFAALGNGFTYVNETPDSGDTWTKIAISTQFPLPDFDHTPDTDTHIHSGSQFAQSFRVPMSGDTFYTLGLKLRKTGSPPGNLVVTIYEEDTENRGLPDTSAEVTHFNIAPGDVSGTYTWVEKAPYNTTQFDLRAGLKYFIHATYSGGDSSNCYHWGRTDGSKAAYAEGNALTYTTEWEDRDNSDFQFVLKRDTIDKLYYVMVESDYAFGWFNDGIRQSTDGYNWTPEPPDPLWVVPSGEGTVLNATAIPKSFIAGTDRGLWAFVGGSSGLNIWHFPDYINANNFRGMERWNAFAIFTVEEQGIFYTDGSQLFPTAFTHLEEGFTFKSGRHIHTSGNDVYACVSNDGSTWYLLRANLNYQGQPKYWWIVKQLAKEPVHMAGWDPEKVFIFYSDNTWETFNKVDGPHVSSGYYVTSIIDENLVKIMKLYSNVSVIYDAFPTDTTSKLSFRKDTDCSAAIGSSWTDSSVYSGDGSTAESVYELPNPTVGNRIQIKNTLETTDTDKTPVVTDLLWKYILEKPSEDVLVKRSFNFTILAEDWLEDNLGDKQVLYKDREFPRTREEIISDLNASAGLKQVLNFIGPDNNSEVGLKLSYDGAGTSCICTIDRTNYLISTAVDGTPDTSYVYKDKTIKEVSDYFDGLGDYSCSVHRDQEDSRSAHDMEPRNDLEIKSAESYVMVGSDIHTVIMESGSPSQTKQSLDGRGSDRLQVRLREA